MHNPTFRIGVLTETAFIEYRLRKIKEIHKNAAVSQKEYFFGYKVDEGKCHFEVKTFLIIEAVEYSLYPQSNLIILYLQFSTKEAKILLF